MPNLKSGDGLTNLALGFVEVVFLKARLMLVVGPWLKSHLEFILSLSLGYRSCAVSHASQ